MKGREEIKGYGFDWTRISLRRFISTARAFVVVCAVCLLAGCLPTGNQNVNTDLFKDKEDLKHRAQSLKAGMSKETAFKKLEIPPEKFGRMAQADLQTAVYGNSMVQGTPEQLEQFRQRLTRFEGFTLPYRDIRGSRSIGFGTMKTTKSGHDLKLILVFEHDKLIKAQVEGAQDVNQSDDQYIWDFLLNRGIGIAL